MNFLPEGMFLVSVAIVILYELILKGRKRKEVLWRQEMPPGEADKIFNMLDKVTSLLKKAETSDLYAFEGRANFQKALFLVYFFSSQREERLFKSISFAVKPIIEGVHRCLLEGEVREHYCPFKMELKYNEKSVLKITVGIREVPRGVKQCFTKLKRDLSILRKNIERKNPIGLIGAFDKLREGINKYNSDINVLVNYLKVKDSLNEKEKMKRIKQMIKAWNYRWDLNAEERDLNDVFIKIAIAIYLFSERFLPSFLKLRLISFREKFVITGKWDPFAFLVNGQLHEPHGQIVAVEFLHPTEMQVLECGKKEYPIPFLKRLKLCASFPRKKNVAMSNVA